MALKTEDTQLGKYKTGELSLGTAGARTKYDQIIIHKTLKKLKNGT